MTTKTTHTTKYSTLHTALGINGIFSGISGILFIAVAGPIATFMGLEAPGILRIIGVLLLIFAADLFWIAQGTINLRLATAVIAGDVLWVVGSAVILLTDLVPLTTGGKWGVAIVADIVALFAIWQFYGVRQQRKANQ